MGGDKQLSKSKVNPRYGKVVLLILPGRFGVCCVFIVNDDDGGDVTQNCSYIQNPDFNTATTNAQTFTYTIEKCSNGGQRRTQKLYNVVLLYMYYNTFIIISSVVITDVKLNSCNRKLCCEFIRICSSPKNILVRGGIYCATTTFCLSGFFFSSDVCSIRLDFETFTLNGLGDNNEDGTCGDQMTVTVRGGTSLA